MRNQHKKLVRTEMEESGKYCHDVCNMSLSDISSVIIYSKMKIGSSITNINSGANGNYKNVLLELEEYMFEFTARLSNRTMNFRSESDPDFKKNKIFNSDIYKDML